MPQIARPLADVSKGLWTPTPVFAAIDEMNEAGADATFVTSGNVAGDSFEVDLASMAYANSLPQTLKVRLRKTTADNNQVTLTLFEGTTMVAYRVIPGSQITQTFTTKTFPLTYSEISNISDYTDIRLKVTAGFATNTNCSLNPAGVPNTWRVACSGIFAGTCVDCNVLNRPWDMPVIGPCHWSNSYQPYKNFCGNNDLTLDLGPAGNLVVLVIYKGNTVIAQYQQTLAAWHWLSSNTMALNAYDYSCTNWPATITVDPV